MAKWNELNQNSPERQPFEALHRDILNHLAAGLLAGRAIKEPTQNVRFPGDKHDAGASLAGRES